MGRGLVAFGYNYLGPWNDLNRGEPTNRNDAVARKHDIAYAELAKAGKSPYTDWNGADEDFLNKLQPDDAATYIAEGMFVIKKEAAAIGILKTNIHDIDATSWMGAIYEMVDNVGSAIKKMICYANGSE